MPEMRKEIHSVIAVDWDSITLRFNSMIDELFHRGSIGINILVVKVFPLRDRLESGERTEELYSAIEEAIQHYG